MADTRTLTADDTNAYHAAETRLRSAWTRVGLALGAIMMPSGFGLDYLLYRDQFRTLFAVRCVTSIILGAGLIVALRKNLGRGVFPFSVVLIAIPALAICSMIALTDGGRSQYYIGLILLMVVVQLLGFSLRESAAYCGTVVVAYAAAVGLRGGLGAEDVSRFLFALFFLVTVGAVVVTMCFLNERRRFSDFLLQRELDEKNRKLEELDRLRSDLLANVSHELRTPLSLIIGPVDDILHGGGVPSHIGQTLAIVRKNTDRLRVLVDDLLDVVRIDHAALRLEPEAVDAREFLLSVVATVRPLAEERGLRLETAFTRTPLELHIDVDRMERVFLNLIGNALKFSPAETTVRLTLAADGDTARITVEDQGPGIPDADLGRIFERFYQASGNNARPSQGLGLGLALVKDIVGWHSGGVTVTSQVGVGTCFTVTLPANVATAAVEEIGGEIGEDNASPTEPLPDHSMETSEAAGPVQILVIDDEPDLRKFLTNCLARDFHTLSAPNGVRGLEIALQVHPVVILLDVMLPDIDGLEVLRRIRQSPDLAATRVIMVTANLDENIKLDALRRGADDFLSKPFGMTEVRARVNGLLQRAGMQAELLHEKEELRRSLLKLQETETKLFQSEKMRAVGHLAAGLLHEINNPVHYTTMAVKALETDLAKGKDVSEIVTDVRDGIRRIGEVVSDLRTFAYPEQAHQQSAFPVRDATKTALQFTAGIRDGVDTQVDIPESLVVQGARSQIIQLLVNLISNAAEATAARRKTAPPDYVPQITISAAANDGRARITVTDNGVGIEADKLSRIFEPFYTTAPIGKGLGLGLSICHSIAHSHGGDLVVRSEPNRGAQFTFDLELSP